ncbi:MAG: carbohydrate ABC transporter permease [Proteobacteria bacterium]|nr:carbohydrate ABC transporter permease [Pseudomonadota bacterium]
MSSRFASHDDLAAGRAGPISYSESKTRLIFAAAWRYVAIFSIILALMWPVAWMVSTSFKMPDEIFTNPPRWIPSKPTLEGYRAAFSAQIVQNFWNSIVIAAGTTIVAVGAGALTAYGMSRLDFRGKATVMLLILATLGIPIPLLMISLYVLFARVDILNTYAAVILGHVAITLPVVIWLLRDFVDSIPKELEEAAAIDGAGPFYVLFRIVFPLMQPGLAASAIFVFVTSWNEFIFGVTFASSSDRRPLPAGITDLFLQELQYRWGDTMAVGIIVTLPVMVLFLMFQRFFVHGVTVGAVKG